MIKSTWRGHKIKRVGNNWFFCDINQNVLDFNIRECGYCGKVPHPEGYDACIGFIPGVESACCGHGIKKEAYIVFRSGVLKRGSSAVKAIKRLKNEIRELSDHLRKFFPGFYNSLNEDQKSQLWGFWDNGFFFREFESVLDKIIIEPKGD